MNLQAIPFAEMPEIDIKNFNELNEPLVDISEYSNNTISVEMKYFEAKRNGAVNKAYVRKSVADMLIAAQGLLPEGFRLKIYDAWRPFEVQKDLYDEYYEKVRSDPENFNKSEIELHRLAKTFVSYPDTENKFSYVHASGGAVDLTVINAENEELDMGCSFDDFSETAYTHALENTDKTVQRDNRRLLYHCMYKAGFTNYPYEWWHFDYGDIFWGALTKNKKIYPSIYSMK